MSKRVYSATERAAAAGNDAAAENESVADLRAMGSSTSGENDARTEASIPDFPAECLPPILQKMARAIATVRRVPLGMPAPMILSTGSASIGKGLCVRDCIPGYSTFGNLFSLVCKTSGSGGSVTFRDATAPFVGKQKSLRREFEREKKPRLDAELTDISAQIAQVTNSLKKAAGAEREEIINRLAKCNEKKADLEKRASGITLYATNVTPEALAPLMEENGEAFAHFESDASDALGIISGALYNDGKQSRDDLWLKSYSGDPVSIRRKNSPPVTLHEPILAVLFVATPDTVQELYRNPRLTAGGLLPRFLACDPHARPMPIDVAQAETPRTLPTDVTQPYEAAIWAAVDRYRLSANDDPDVIVATPEARRLCIEDWNRFCEIAKGGVDAPFEARETENAIRIALVLHVFLHCETRRKEGSEGTYNATMHGHEHSLDAETMRNALRIRDWFTAHQEELRAPERVAAEDSAFEKTEALLHSRPAGITPRDLYTGHRVCRDATTAERLLAQWKEQGRVIAFKREPEGAGRPTTAYKLAPKVRGL